VSGIRRRDVVILLGGAAAAWPLAASAQQPAMPVIGFLSTSSRRVDDVLRLAPFRQGLKEAGYVEGLNVGSEYRGAEEHYERLPELAADLLRRQVAVIVALGGPPTALAAKAASTMVPIVFTITSADPVQLGLVASFNRPGGNVTGIATVPGSVVSKQFEALHEAVPTATVIGCLLNPNHPNIEATTREAQEATRTLGLKLEVLYARDDTEIETAFATIVQKRVDALVVVTDAVVNDRRAQLVALTTRHMLPSIFPFREFATAGGLMSYGPSFGDAFRQAGIYTGRILKGEKPADLPVIQAGIDVDNSTPNHLNIHVSETRLRH
jgi:putative tryptophan/tyrosine transport system substrate-binding protein